MIRNTMNWNQAEARLETLDVKVAIAFFPRLTLADVWRLVKAAEPGTKFRTLAKKLFHWRWNLRIANFQRLANLHASRDNKSDFVHIALLAKIGGVWWLYEATHPEGVTKQKPRGKAKRFARIITAVPVPNGSTEALEDWLNHIEGQRYAVGASGSSPFATFSIAPLGKFCSMLGAQALACMNRLPKWRTHPDFERNMLVDYEVKPGDYMPSTLARDGEALPSELWHNAILIKED